jgi:hypothetical protein
MPKATTHAPNVCQVCREEFDSPKAKAVHVTLEHDLRRTGGDSQTLKFAACVACGARTYLTLTHCECGQEMRPL